MLFILTKILHIINRVPTQMTWSKFRTFQDPPRKPWNNQLRTIAEKKLQVLTARMRSPTLSEVLDAAPPDVI